MPASTSNLASNNSQRRVENNLQEIRLKCKYCKRRQSNHCIKCTRNNNKPFAVCHPEIGHDNECWSKHLAGVPVPKKGGNK